MKKKLSVLLALAMALCLSACGSKNVKLGEPVEKGVARITVNDVQLGNTHYVEGGTYSDDFLSPISEDDIELGDHYIKSFNEDEGVVVISLTMENIGKSDWTIHPFDYVVNYDDGNKYSSKKCYAKVEGGEWTEFENITLEKVTSGAIEVRIAVWVPNVIIDDSKSLSLDFHGFSYKIR